MKFCLLFTIMACAGAVKPPTRRNLAEGDYEDATLGSSQLRRRLSNSYEIAEAVVTFTEGAAATTGPSPTPATPSTITVLFSHDPVTDIGNSNVAQYGTVALSFFDAGCVTPLNTVTPITSATETTGASSSTDVAADFGFDTSHTVAEETQIVMDLAELQQSVVSDNKGSSGVVNIDFCVRLTITDTTSGEKVGFREVDIDIDYDLANLVTLEVNGNDIDPDDDTVELGDFSIAVYECGAGVGGTAQTTYVQGDVVETCFSARVTDGNSATDNAPQVTFEIDEFTYFIDDTTANNFADPGEVQQTAIVNGADSPLTDSVKGDGVASPNGPLNDIPLGIYGYAVYTTLKQEFYDTGAAAAGAAVTVKGRGLATITFRGRRRQLAISVGDQATVSIEPYTVSIVAESAEAESSSSCDFWCWLFSCFGLF